MKTPEVLIIAVAAVAVAYLLSRAVASRGTTTVINEAPERGTAEQVLTGIGELASGLGDLAGGVGRALTPSYGGVSSSSG
jgi:X-X-X-Leu-X-X-Gly heptad repeat protein